MIETVAAGLVERGVDARQARAVRVVALLLDHEDLGLEHRERLRGRAVAAERVSNDLPAAHANRHDAGGLPDHGARVVRRVSAGLDEQDEELLYRLQERRGHVLDRVEGQRRQDVFERVLRLDVVPSHCAFGRLPVLCPQGEIREAHGHLVRLEVGVRDARCLARERRRLPADLALERGGESGPDVVIDRVLQVRQRRVREGLRDGLRRVEREAETAEDERHPRPLRSIALSRAVSLFSMRSASPRKVSFATSAVGFVPGCRTFLKRTMPPALAQ